MKTSLDQLAELCVTGQAAAAELELHALVREPDCAPEARVMLAALLARRGEHDHALTVLGDAQDNARVLFSRLCLLLEAEHDSDEVVQVVRVLHLDYGHEPWVRRLLAVMQPPGIESLRMTADSHVEQLAAELMPQPEIVRSLVVAQQLEPNTKQIDLLRRAVARVAPHFENDRRLVMLCQAMAELSLLAGDHAEARRWAHRGLKLDAYAAPLALVLAKIEDDAAVGPPAHEVLQQVSERYPAYPDVRAALIRREMQAGRADEAHRRLSHWLEDEPDNRTARKVQAELGLAA